MPSHRQDPAKLLQRIQEEEQQEKRGKLKIYLGAAPGVGKTYTMLKDAISQREKGLDVVVGLVETHGREEIVATLAKLDVLPRKEVDYRGTILKEFDIDGALKRAPALILVDEMAHTNAPGLRHAKRWQDIKELLDRGINVYTTLNVQHIESLNDDVSQIIHAPIKETVPDTMLELADTIELVDLPPEELLKRLQEGKIYIPEQATLAADQFFRKGNLIALRELALRFTADRVGTQVLLYRQGQGIQHIWPTKDKILVCVDSRPESIKLIRAAKRIANSLQTQWMAVYVDVTSLRSSGDKRNLAIQHLRLAEQLGAQTKILTGFDIVHEILSFAREQNVTQIMVWKHIRSRWLTYFSRSLADEIVRHSREIDVYIMTGERQQKTEKSTIIKKRSIPWKIYGVAIAIVLLSTGVSFLVSPFLSDSNLVMIYLLGVTVIALFGRAGPSIAGSILSVLAYDFFFIPPYYSFAISDAQYFFTLVVMLIVTQVISQLTIITRRQMDAVRLTEYQTSALYVLSRQLATTRGVDKLLKIAIHYISDIFNCEVIALLPKNHHLAIRATSHRYHALDQKEMGVAQWVYELGQIAGLGTDTLSFSKALYVPLLGSHGAIGVLQIQPLEKDRWVSPEQMQLLQACSNQVAVALEVDRLHDQAGRSKFKVETNRARSALMESVLHDLRTPLVAIIGAATTQVEMAKELNPASVEKIGREIHDEAEQLNRIINNLLQVSYLEAETVKLQKIPVSLKELIMQVAKAVTMKSMKHPIDLAITGNIPPVACDATLIQEVLNHLIDNAIKFTPPKSLIKITATNDNENAIVSVEDNGPGIVPDEVEKLFDKFYRGRALTTERGLGLGLAICQGVIKAHHGKIWAENRKNGGAVFRFTLPL